MGGWANKPLGTLCLKMRWGLSQLLKFDRNPEIPVATRENPWVSRLKLRWGSIPLQPHERNPEVPLETWKEAWLSWYERFPEVPIATREEPKTSCWNSRNTMRFPLNARWGPIPLQWLKSNPVLPLATWKVTWIPRGNSRGSLRSQSHVKWNFKLPTATLEKPWGYCSMLDETLFHWSPSRATPCSLSKMETRLDSLYTTCSWDFLRYAL